MFIFLPFALTIPAVTVEAKLKGFPTASTHSPIWTSSLFPYCIGVSSCLSILIIAKSVVGSVPINFAENDSLLFNVSST